MPISIQQAITVTGYFNGIVGGSAEIEQKIIKRLTNEQRDICYEAFKKLKETTLKDVDEGLNQNALDNNVIVAFKTSLDTALAPDEPEAAWYAKPFYFIAHKINSFAKGFANIFWRVGSGALSNKVADYRSDVTKYDAELKSYYHQTAGDTGNKDPAYIDNLKRIQAAKKDYQDENDKVENLEKFYNIFSNISTTSHYCNVLKQRAEQTNLSSETRDCIKHIPGIKEHKNLKITTLSEIVIDSLEQKPKPGLDTDILGALWIKAVTISDDNKKAKKDKLDELEVKYAVTFANLKQIKTQIGNLEQPLEDIETEKHFEIGKKRFETLGKINQFEIEFKESIKGKAEAEAAPLKIEHDKKIKEVNDALEKELINISAYYDAAYEKKANELGPTIKPLVEDHANQLKPYLDELKKAKEDLKAAKIIKTKKDNEDIAEEINKIARDKLDTIYNSKVSEQGTLHQTTAQYEAVVKERIRLENTEKLLKIMYPQLEPIGNDVVLDLDIK